MAPKRPAVAPNPPPSSSSESGSEEEEDETSSSPPSPQPQEKPSLKKPKPTPQHDSTPKSPRPNPSDNDDEDEESSDDEDDAHRFNIKPSQPKTQPKSDSDSSESDPDPSPKKPVPDVKPINSKPLDEKPKKPAPSKPAATPSPQKRPDEPGKDVKDSKRRRKVGSNASADEPAKKQQGFARLWSEEDEIAILKGMAEYTKKGSNPTSDKEGFHSFVKDSLHVEVSTTQLSDKITRLKKKYQTNLKRATKGKEPDFAKPHEKTAYDLSKKIWGGNMDGEDDDIGVEANGGDSVPVNAKASGVNGGDLVQVKAKASGSRSRKTTVKAATPAKVLAFLENRNPEVVNRKAQIESLYSHVSRNLNLLAYDERILKKGFNLIEPSKAKGLEERWKELELMEMNLYKRRIALIKDQIDLTFDALEQSDI
ncbi:STOREKEEPER protein-like [Tasmannia lanceolata]|uniref:STOREKEEPER protein-like n=1 Tax=Tasmannia lanceolata TaxID=3420 RepID=UPI0040644377